MSDRERQGPAATEREKFTTQTYHDMVTLPVLISTSVRGRSNLLNSQADWGLLRAYTGNGESIYWIYLILIKCQRVFKVSLCTCNSQKADLNLSIIYIYKYFLDIKNLVDHPFQWTLKPMKPIPHTFVPSHLWTSQANRDHSNIMICVMKYVTF